ncbi:DUF2290 domain-containing protein [Nocardioides cynanchi]|uniref:DUF2290 domain-containing protein n=1 Tax=Nocardioides cynanchi TaxID=2558918 RepID=UPI00177B527C|nr:DUF2290 domain-containing protein [Nocardioides cynanchi]
MDSELAAHRNPVSISESVVSFHGYAPKGSPFILNRRHPTIEQYRYWVEHGEYSALLFDGSLLQLAYTVKDGELAGHRLAYVPCPYDVDQQFVMGGDPLLEVIDLFYADAEPLLRTPVRMDFDPDSAKPGHPEVHLTINGSDCRIACVAPLHVLRFVSFVFEQFYPAYWRAHKGFFAPGHTRHVGPKKILEVEQIGLHLSWNVHATLADLGDGPA